MNEEVLDKVTDYIDAIAENLGVAAEHVYPLMVEQMVLEGWIAGGSLIISTVLFCLMFGFALKYTIKHWDDLYHSDNEIWTVVGCLILGVIALILLIASFASVPTYIMKIMNPEYYVFKDLISILN
ncbi:hypothetical protein [Bacillus sp. Marseille-P3800]|uniref:hypothetical protein n=1 Tax=Bacillus sp. Marseille-P3800 TaxID=2014782 RepID=UPI000C077558|nr:hypothetical protein [Bacillus sp. Marseille-P3800]